MELASVQNILLTILTSIIAGGFVLVFVEIGNRKNRENDRYDQIMQPFMHKLSSYLRFLSWSGIHIKYPTVLNCYEDEFKNLVESIGRYGGCAITSGGDYGVGYFSAKQLHKICSDINNIWYYYYQQYYVKNLKTLWHTVTYVYNSPLRGTLQHLADDIENS